MYINLYDYVGLNDIHPGYQYNFHCEPSVLNNDSKLLKECISAITKQSTALCDIKAISKQIRVDKQPTTTLVMNISLNPSFGLQLCKIKISGISDGHILCIMMQSHIVNEMIALIKKKYKPGKGDFVFKNKKLNVNSTMAECRFIINTTNDVRFEKSAVDKRIRIKDDLQKDDHTDPHNDVAIVSVKNKRKTIPQTLRKQVWYEYIGKEIGTAKCTCCKKEDIGQMDFQCGHVVSAHDGGLATIDNLRPICLTCNQSMGTQNMNTFMEQYGLIR